MLSGISILIPTFNDCSLNLVQELSRQSQSINSGINIEIIVADDGSNNDEIIKRNRFINSIDKSRYIERKINSGRSAIKNFLVNEAKYDWLLFIDGDMSINKHDFLKTYISNVTCDVVYGGYILQKYNNDLRGNLRYKYEFKSQPYHTTIKRKKNPYKDFHTSNFMVKKSIMQEIPFDEKFRQYGYEDVFWGKQLQMKNYKINHIDNPVVFNTFEDNDSFIRKTDEGIRTLYTHRKDLNNYSRIIDCYNYLQKLHMNNFVVLIFNILNKIIKRNLLGTNPSLFLFKLYRLGYYCKLSSMHREF